jgi:hypothetical protein
MASGIGHTPAGSWGSPWSRHPRVFQSAFGMIFTIAIASGFEHSLPMVQAWSVLAAAMPAARKSSSWI